ncbi:MAG: pyocin activator PrtN family protein [Xanthobacteraceae bacterium]
MKLDDTEASASLTTRRATLECHLKTFGNQYVVVSRSFALSAGRRDYSIALPVVRMETSQKSARGVHLCDLADYLDKRRAAALKECQQLYGAQ